MFFLFLPVDKAAPLMLPDSLQKASLSKTLSKLSEIDIHQVISGMIGDAIWIALKLLLALAIYFIGRWIVHRIVRILDIAFERRQVDESLRSFLRTTIRVVCTLILVMIVVQTLGVNVTSLIALFSAATLAIGMALSGTAQNFAGGVMVLLMKPYRVGDYISAQGQTGTVREIKLFSTVIATIDNQTIYIPNNTISSSIIDNYSTAEFRRVDWTVGLSYGDDMDVARTAILEMLAADPRILHEPDVVADPVVRLVSLADSSVQISIRAWTKNDDYWEVFFEHNEQFYKELPKRGLSFPFPQMDVHVKQN